MFDLVLLKPGLNSTENFDLLSKFCKDFIFRFIVTAPQNSSQKWFHKKSVFTCSKWTIERLEQGETYVQSQE